MRIGTDNTVTVIAKNLEMGQGIYTGFATLVAEELCADWGQVQVEGAPADMKLYANQVFGMQGTGGRHEHGIVISTDAPRRRFSQSMIVAAAASRWNVPPDSITVSRGVVSHSASGRTSTFGELAEDASKQPVPPNVKLKDARDFELIGKAQLARKDSAGKTDGTAIFTQDVKLPGMLVAVVAHPTRWGTTLKSFDGTKAKAVPGMVEVVQFDASSPNGFPGVAVLAKNTWAARQGRNALVVQWDESKAFKLGSDEILAQYREAAKKEGPIARKEGNIAAAFAGQVKLIEAEYEFPYLAHASMEPLNCVVKLSEGRCEIWNGEAIPDRRSGIGRAFPGNSAGAGLNHPAVRRWKTSDGGAQSRCRLHSRGSCDCQSGPRQRSQRSDQNGVDARGRHARRHHYRAINVHRARLAVDGSGHLVAWHQRIVGQSIVKGT